jgi:hypothetical protein
MIEQKEWDAMLKKHIAQCKEKRERELLVKCAGSDTPFIPRVVLYNDDQFQNEMEELFKSLQLLANPFAKKDDQAGE